MLKAEVVDKIIKYFKLTDFEAENLYNDIFESIIQGVADDNIADITNLGEFIVKYSNGKNISEDVSSYKKTVEFIPVSTLQEDVDEVKFEAFRTVEPETVLSQSTIEAETLKKEDPQIESSAGERLNVEEELNRKRDEMLQKIIAPVEEYKPAEVYRPAEENKPAEEYKSDETPEEENQTGHPFDKSQGSEAEVIENEEIEQPSQKSFSDYFTVKDEKKEETPFVPPPAETVIPPAAIELHKELTQDNGKEAGYKSPLETTSLTNGSGKVDGFEKRAGDNSYYIWYKDSEPNIADTQTMSYEYELLYQATKEAEYKSKLKIYVTTFILFFSIVLLLLIFSPVFYKIFFTPRETDNTEQIEEESGTITNEEPSPENKASLNTLNDGNNAVSETNSPHTTTNTEDNTQQTQQIQQEHSKQEEPKQVEQNVQKMSNQIQSQPPQQQAPATQPNTQSNMQGLVKNGLGWFDEKNKVVYIQLENGKFTIQESAWDSEAKASKRVGTLESLIPGVKGSIVRVDLGEKGVWYRVRFGEFSSIDEARAKAVELKKKG